MFYIENELDNIVVKVFLVYFKKCKVIRFDNFVDVVYIVKDNVGCWVNRL